MVAAVACQIRGRDAVNLRSRYEDRSPLYAESQLQCQIAVLSCGTQWAKGCSLFFFVLGSPGPDHVIPPAKFIERATKAWQFHCPHRFIRRPRGRSRTAARGARLCAVTGSREMHHQAAFTSYMYLLHEQIIGNLCCGM